MLKTIKEETAWLNQLQKDMLADRKNETTQADPLYYSIHDFKSRVTAEGHEDRFEFYNPDTGESYTEEDIFLAMEQDHIDQHIDDDVISEEKPHKINNNSEFASFLEDTFGIQAVPVEDVGYVVPNTLFLTRDDAAKHLTSNAHHYTNCASTYAMTAWRSPRYGHLIELLRTIDFEASTIVFRHPGEKWIPKETWIENAKPRIIENLKKEGLPENLAEDFIAWLLPRVPFRDMAGHEHAETLYDESFGNERLTYLIQTWAEKQRSKRKEETPCPSQINAVRNPSTK